MIAAICFFAGVPFDIDHQGRICFASTGLEKVHGEWIVLTNPVEPGD